jgi:cystathionine beta-synthase
MRNNNAKSSILDCIGNTPLIRLEKMEEDLPCQLWAKVEAFNPGHSAKDRIVNYMLNDAEERGLIKPGDTIVEATSGNTGFSIAMWCAKNGYSCKLTVTTKTSKEKRDMLRAMGADVTVCPSVSAEDPCSYYEVAKRYAMDTPGAFYLNQNFDTNNAEAHYHTTGPEIWEQTEGKVTHFIGPSGTGGTLCGVAKYLKEKNPAVTIIGVDGQGSVLKKYFDEGIFDESIASSYKVEGLGKTIIPGNFLTEYIDMMIMAGDKDSALMARQLARTEGLMMGYSSGAVMYTVLNNAHLFKPGDLVVAMFPDHGSRYISKIYNDDWMREQGFLPAPKQNGKANGHAKNGELVAR